MDTPIGRHQIVVVPCVNPRLEILPAPLRIEMGRPSDSKRMHSIFCFQDMRCVKTVLTARAWYDAVVGTITLAVLIAKLTQLLFSINPVDGMAFAFGKVTGIAN